ncbi:MAG: cell division protein ZapA [Deltaproteobacteria bacterium]|nr:cell division protein ZapA [Deltaproteobacteria bacterium]
MKNLVRVEILGLEFVVKSDEKKERVEKIAAYVNQKIREISGGPQTVSTLNAAILAALNIADDYFKVLEEKGSHRQDYEGKAEHLIAMIDARIQE